MRGGEEDCRCHMDHVRNEDVKERILQGGVGEQEGRCDGKSESDR